MPDVYAISSAKGGVGKTTTAANLAATLAAAGHSVVAVDGDIGTPNLGPALGVEPGPDDPTVHDVLAGEAALPEAAYEGPHGVYVVPGADDLESFRRADPSRLADVLANVSGIDYVIVDTSAGLTHESALPLSLADGVLLVTTPDRDALAATRKSLRLTRQLGGTVAGVTLNRATEETTDPEVDAPILGRIPESRALATGSAAGEPITAHDPRGDVALAFRRLASRLAVERVPPPPGVEDVPAGETGSGATAERTESGQSRSAGGGGASTQTDTTGRTQADTADPSRTAGADPNPTGGTDPTPTDATDGGPGRGDVPRGAPGGVAGGSEASSGRPDDTRADHSEPNTGASPDRGEANTGASSDRGEANTGASPNRQEPGTIVSPDRREPDAGTTPDRTESDTGAAPDRSEPRADEQYDDDAVIIEEDEDSPEEDPAAAEARTVLGETVPEDAISREETERGNAVEYEIDRDAIPFSEDEADDDDEDDGGGFLGRLFRS
ncbi:P-loop NTPase [Halobaculum sp. MBLA0147]|uniref:P-loop NTPase n=1 Tax=Halobaculum sp. MBLA0147 TaxID=3079934 RepID=UPI0035269447